MKAVYPGAGPDRPDRCSIKRDGMRFALELDARLRGRGGNFSGTTLNVSRSGVLVAITDEAFKALGGGWNARTERLFRTGADIHFLEAGLKLRADLARVVPAGPGQVPRAAFRFRKTLEAGTCHTLGFENRDDGEESF